MDIAMESLILCRGIEYDRAGRVVVLWDIIRTIQTRGDARIPECHIYGMLSGVRHPIELVVSLTRLAPGDLGPTVTFPPKTFPLQPPSDVRNPIQLVLPFPESILPGPGEYRFEFWHSGRLLGFTRFHVSP